jgi:hypothetical protein
MKSSTDRYELATRTLRRYNLTPTIGSPELTALLAMLRGHIDDVTARAQRTVDQQHDRAEAINLGLNVVWARGGAGRG